MEKKVKITFLKDKHGLNYFFIIIYKKYKYKQYILDNNLLYTFFMVIFFLYKYGFIKIRKKKNVCI